MKRKESAETLQHEAFLRQRSVVYSDTVRNEAEAYRHLVLRQNLAHLWNQSVNQPPTFEQSGKILP